MGCPMIRYTNTGEVRNVLVPSKASNITVRRTMHACPCRHGAEARSCGRARSCAWTVTTSRGGRTATRTSRRQRTTRRSTGRRSSLSKRPPRPLARPGCAQAPTNKASTRHAALDVPRRQSASTSLLVLLQTSLSAWRKWIATSHITLRVFAAGLGLVEQRCWAGG